MEYARRIDLSGARKKSLFLFGPRMTGKTHLLRKAFPRAPSCNLLESDVFFRYAAHPRLLREEVHARKNRGEPVIIDEIQKLPVLLDEVHTLIESTGQTFILTGSSPRKIRGGSANLLGGRARTRHLHPLSWCELDDFKLEKMLNFGGLPAIWTSQEPDADLRAYCGSYLQQEIQAEGAVRRIENFSRFLATAALGNATLLNFESIARDAQVPARTVREYYYILEETLLGRLLPNFPATGKRKAPSRGKFYFFDIGVANLLAGRQGIKAKGPLFGPVFEHFIFMEIFARLSYAQDPRPLTFWQDKAGHEVDFMIADETAIEVKGSSSISSHDLKGMRRLHEERKTRHSIVVSLDPTPRRLEGIDILPWEVFLERLWGGSF
jgi:predicted AAA+ superfamily ATPase